MFIIKTKSDFSFQTRWRQPLETAFAMTVALVQLYNNFA